MGQVTLATYEYDTLLREHYELQRIVDSIKIVHQNWNNKKVIQFDSVTLLQLAQKTKELHLKEDPFSFLPNLQLDVLEQEKHPLVEEVKDDETT